MSLGQIIQLAALGVQNLYLNIKPQYTMFRKSYKRHTNYATQVVRVQSNTTATWGSKVDFDLTRNGDLIAETYLVVQLPCITGGIYKDEKWWPTAYKAVPGYINPDKDHWSHRGDHLVAHVGKRLSEDKAKKRVQAVVGATANESTGWHGHPKTQDIDPSTNGTTKDTGILVGPSHSQVAYADSLGHAIIKDARFFIAQNVIQEFTGEYMHIHHLMNNPGESLNEALFSYGDDMHAQGPQGGSLADGVGFQASKYGHGAIASGGYWVDMEATKTDPRLRMGSLVSDTNAPKYSKDSKNKKRITQLERKQKTNYHDVSASAVSKIGRSMAFLPLASQTYVGMCFHNASAANAHIDYTDKGMDTRSAESPYCAGVKIGNLAIVGETGGYCNYDNWNGETTAEAKLRGGVAFQEAVSADTWFNGTDADKQFTEIRKSLATQTAYAHAFYIVPRGIRSRTQARGIGLHDHAGYHGSLVRVEDSVGSGLHVSDKYIGLDEFNAAQSVPSVLSEAVGADMDDEDLAILTMTTASNNRTPFDVGQQDEDLFFNTPASTHHHNHFNLRNQNVTDTNITPSAVRLYFNGDDDSATNTKFADKVQQGDAIYMKSRRLGLPTLSGSGRQIQSLDNLFAKHGTVEDADAPEQGQIFCLKVANTTGISGGLPQDRFAIALSDIGNVGGAGTDTEFKAAHDILKAGGLTAGRVIRMQARGLANTGSSVVANKIDPTDLKFAVSDESRETDGTAGACTLVTHLDGTNSKTTLANAGFTETDGSTLYDDDSSLNHTGNLFILRDVEFSDSSQVLVNITATSVAALDPQTDTPAPSPAFGTLAPASTVTADSRLVVATDAADSKEMAFGIDFFPTFEQGVPLSLDANNGDLPRRRASSDGRILLGYAGKKVAITGITTPIATGGKLDLPLFKTRAGALDEDQNDVDKVDANYLRSLQPADGFSPSYIDISTTMSNAAIFIEPMGGLSRAETLLLGNKIISQSKTTLKAMVGDMLRTEFHRGGKQSGSQYFDSESTAGCGPRASLGALMYTAACAQPIGSAPACSQLASDIIIPQYTDAITDPKDLTFGTRMMVALDRSSNLQKVSGVPGLQDGQDKETARLVKNYNPGPAYEVVGSRLDTSMYSKLRTHAQMNTGFGRRAQISAVGNHQLEDGSGKCVQVVVPMPWWYAEGPACDGRRTQALPMIALQYHNVSISVNLRAFEECVQTDREHRSQPFRCSKMIGSLGTKALADAKSEDCPESSGDKAQSFAAMPTTAHGAREGSTMVDTLGSFSNMYPQERAVTCVNMHSVKDTLSGLRYKGEHASYYSALEGVDDPTAAYGGAHLISKVDQSAETAAGYQGHVDERHHVDVGTWLNFGSDMADYKNSKGESKARNQQRIGTFDGEHFTTSGDRFKTDGLNGKLGTRTGAEGDFGGTDGGDVTEWGQAEWSAKMSTATSALLSKISKVPLAAVFGKGQTNGGFAIHSEAQAIGSKLALTGNATVCSMKEAIQENADVCNVFTKANGTQGWKTAGSLASSKSELQLIGAHLLVTFVFLDSSERRLFASNAHEYLITQVQKQEQHSGAITQSGTMHQISMDLKFNHPVSHLFWVLQRPESQWAREWFRYEATHGAGDPLMIRAELSLNSSKREEENYLNATNTTVIEPWNYFKKCNNTGVGGALKSHSFDGTAANIHTYSFAQNPGEWYPTGSLNFSRIDRVELKLYCKAHAEAHLTHPLVWGGGGYRELNTELNNAAQGACVEGATAETAFMAAYGELAKGIDVRVYARNFNVLRIQSGMGAIKYAN